MKSIDQIAAELAGYDPNSLRADKVNAFLAELVKPVIDTETLALFDGLNRVLAEDIVSPISVPPHDNSAMDGFAFNGGQLAANTPLSVVIVGTALAGGRKIGAWAAQHNLARVDFNQAHDDPKAFYNANTLQDLQQLDLYEKH